MARSFATRLTYRIMAVVLVMMCVITGAVYYSVRTYMFDEAQDRYVGFLLRNLEELRRRISDVYVATTNNVYVIEQDVDDPEKVSAHLKRVASENSSLVTSAVLYKPGYLPNRKRCVEIFAACDSSNLVHVDNLEKDHNIYMDWEWFQRGISEDSTGWTDVYIETNDLLSDGMPRQLITFYTPLHNRQGEAVGLLCSDLSLEFLRRKFLEDIISTNKKFEQGSHQHSYCFIIDRDGDYIMHPNKHYIHDENFFEQLRGGSNTADSIVNNIMARKDGSAMLDIDGVPSWIHYRPVKHVEWTIAIVVPEEVIFHNGRMLNMIILVIFIIGLIAIYLICRRTISDTTTPVTAQKAAFERELKIANGIQMSMLPKVFPPFPDRHDIDIYAKLKPAREVGGDLYDYLLRDEKLFFCVGDVSGKGVPAALIMAVMRSMFRNEARNANSAASIVTVLNRVISTEQSEGFFVTMFVGILDLRTGHLNYCNAGHEAPFLTSRRSLDTVPLSPLVPNLPVGVLSDWVYEEHDTDLHSGDRLFLYTDGLNEAMSPTQEMFGRRHALELVRQHAEEPPVQLVELMAEEVRRHADTAELNDDITLLALRWTPEESADKDVSQDGGTPLVMKADMSDISKMTAFVQGVCGRAGLDNKESAFLRLAVEEAVANVINYAEATTVTLQNELADGQLRIEIADDGKPFDPTAYACADISVPADQRPPGGLGIVFLRRMTDHVAYERRDNRNVLTLTKEVRTKNSNL